MFENWDFVNTLIKKESKLWFKFFVKYKNKYKKLLAPLNLFLNSKSFCISFTLVLFCIMLVPFYILGENSVFRISDLLEIELIQRMWQAQYIKETGAIYGYSQYIKEALGGELPRHCLFPALNVLVLLLMLFKPVTALIINLTFIRITAFVGMFLLLKKHIFNGDKKNENLLIITGVSCCFMIIPFFTPNGISVAGHALITYAFLNLSKEYKKTFKQHLPNYLILILYGFYSQFVTSGFFVLCVVGVAWFYFAIKHKNFYLKLFFGIVLLTIVYIVTDFNLIRSSFFDPSFVSHRAQQASYMFASYPSMFVIFGTGYSCHVPFFPLLIMIISFPALRIPFVRKKLNYANKILFLYILIFFSCVIHHFVVYFLSFFDFDLTILTALNFTRFSWFSLFVFHIIFVFCFVVLKSCKIIDNFGVFVVLLLQIILSCVWYNGRYNTTWNNQFKFLFVPPDSFVEELSFKQFFDEDLLEEINQYIQKPKNSYYTLSVDLNPAIFQYSGFYTIDGHFSTYPLDYKNRFYNIISFPLSIHDYGYILYNDWGNRVYAFNNIITFDTRIYVYFADEAKLIINTQEAKKMKAEYLFSSFRITNYKEKNLEFLKKFESRVSTRKIYLYKIF